MTWARIMVPLAGGDDDAVVLNHAATVAAAFGAELAVIHTPADIADLMPWMGEGFMGGVQISAIDSLKDAATEGEQLVRTACKACGYEKATFTSLASPVWAGLAMESRLSDVVVFDQQAACGRGPLAEAFQQIVADEQRPVIVAREGLRTDGVAMIGWDGGKEATRAVRTALPLLTKAAKVVIAGAPAASQREFELKRLADYLAARGVKAETRTLDGSGDAGAMLLDAVAEAGADILIAGAFGHTRLREYIFGGTTRSLLNSERPSLFLSH